MTEELLREQIELLREQNNALVKISAHTRLLYVVNWLWIIGSVVGLAIVAGNAGEDSGGAGAVVLVVGGLLIAFMAFLLRESAKPRPQREPDNASTRPAKSRESGARPQGEPYEVSTRRAGSKTCEGSDLDRRTCR